MSCKQRRITVGSSYLTLADAKEQKCNMHEKLLLHDTEVTLC